MRLVNFPVATDMHRYWNCRGSGAGEGRAYNIHKIAGMQASVIYIFSTSVRMCCVSTDVLLCSVFC